MLLIYLIGTVAMFFAAFLLWWFDESVDLSFFNGRENPPLGLFILVLLVCWPFFVFCLIIWGIVSSLVRVLKSVEASRNERFRQKRIARKAYDNRSRSTQKED